MKGDSYKELHFTIRFLSIVDRWQHRQEWSGIKTKRITLHNYPLSSSLKDARIVHPALPALQRQSSGAINLRLPCYEDLGTLECVYKQCFRCCL
ncbi:hypothetical protein NPIL_540911 [Nephila pilipes]|uniref:Uncharacterized protein n=1 Tax=Nephila pilipes TaxID=299642 RepID=A0A8X6PIG0_NEPPI|nr:hypothetical protein NPIL_540911 [Nephila pilipes]